MSAPGNNSPTSCRDKPGRDGVGKPRTIRRVATISGAVVGVVAIAMGAWVLSLGPLPLA